MKSTTRIHGLDALRALMMWLGIVLHSAMIYMKPPVELHRSPETSLIATSLFGWIHIFRMPLFFMLAGFFTALLLRRKGAVSTLLHRAKRIAIPFLLFWPILYVVMNVIIEAHAKRLDPSAHGISFNVQQWITTTGHLWFLYYFIWFTPVTILAALAIDNTLPIRWRQTLLNIVSRIYFGWWGALVIAIPAALLSKGYPASIMTGDGAFLPSASSVAYYYIFYGLGWLVYAKQTVFLPHCTQRWARYLCAAIPTFILANFFGFMALGLLGEELATPEVELIFRLIYSAAVWIWCCVFLGFFLKYFSTQNRVGRYLSDSSYWVYLFHYPIVLTCAYAFYALEYHALVKMTISIGLTSLTCLVSYHLFVRQTWVGRLLNGHPART